jgi:hypothetical protein
LKAVNGGKYTLDMICDGEITWKRGYRIANIYAFIDRESFKYTIYAFDTGTSNKVRETPLHNLTQFLRFAKRSVSCQIITVSAPTANKSEWKILSITHEHLLNISPDAVKNLGTI